jgi:hypothetical protein
LFLVAAGLNPARDFGFFHDRNLCCFTEGSPELGKKSQRAEAEAFLH